MQGSDPAERSASGFPWQRHEERAPLAEFRLDPDAAAVGLDEHTGDVKSHAETRRPRPRSGAVEAVEEARQVLGGDTGAVVADRDQRLVRTRLDGDDDDAAAREVLDRVAEQVLQDLT